MKLLPHCLPSFLLLIFSSQTEQSIRFILSRPSFFINNPNILCYFRNGTLLPVQPQKIYPSSHSACSLEHHALDVASSPLFYRLELEWWQYVRCYIPAREAYTMNPGARRTARLRLILNTGFKLLLLSTCLVLLHF